jgi:methyl-accepting chemotaxis protein
MTDPSKKEISTIVRQVLKETGRASKSSGNPLSTHSAPSRNGPAVLNIFHAGVRKLDEALKQIQQIEETARRSSVYTGQVHSGYR